MPSLKQNIFLALLSANLFLLLAFATSLAAQDTTLQQPDHFFQSNESGDMQNGSITSASLPLHAAVKKSAVLRNLENHYRIWNDQFPSPLVQHSYGMPGLQITDIPRNQEREDWKFYVATVLLLMLAIIRFGYEKEFDELSTVFRHWGASQQMYRELGTGVSFGTVLLNVFSLVVISLFVYILLDRYGNTAVDPRWMLMPMAGIAVAALLSLRYLLLKAASFVLPFKMEITLYNFYEIQLNRVLGVALFPLVLLITFAPDPVNRFALEAAIAVLAAAVLLRYVKGFNIGSNYFGRHLFHFLLYICALEIAPIVIIIRLLQNLGQLRFSF